MPSSEKKAIPLMFKGSFTNFQLFLNFFPTAFPPHLILFLKVLLTHLEIVLKEYTGMCTR